MPRSSTGNEELDRVLGGGLVPGSAILIGGDPGIGKSTLLLQVAGSLSQQCRVLYVSGEESAHQIKMRASRIGVPQDALYVLTENDVESVLEKCGRLQPDVLIIDSIQTMVSQDSASAPGSVSQVRQSAGAIVRFAKETGTSVFIVGHVTKEGSLAGPRVLEHMVDAVLYFEGDRQHEYRLLRAVKNRFGSVNELGVFEMRAEGMVPVTNPSESLLSQRARGISGSVVLCTLQGSRPILCDLQALASRSFYTVPKRTVGGMDSGRVALLLAVMEKRAGKKLFDQDVYIQPDGLYPFSYAQRHGRSGPLRRGPSRGAGRAARGRMRAPGVHGYPVAPAESQAPPSHRRGTNDGRGHADAGPRRSRLIFFYIISEKQKAGCKAL